MRVDRFALPLFLFCAAGLWLCDASVSGMGLRRQDKRSTNDVRGGGARGGERGVPSSRRVWRSCSLLLSSLPRRRHRAVLVSCGLSRAVRSPNPTFTAFHKSALVRCARSCVVKEMERFCSPRSPPSAFKTKRQRRTEQSVDRSHTSQPTPRLATTRPPPPAPAAAALRALCACCANGSVDPFCALALNSRTEAPFESDDQPLSESAPSSDCIRHPLQRIVCTLAWRLFLAAASRIRLCSLNTARCLIPLPLLLSPPL